MMNIRQSHRLMVDRIDGLKFRFVASPNVAPGNNSRTHLVIHSTEGQTVDGAIATFQNVVRGTSAHLILRRDGKEVVQMVEFSRRANHAHAYNTKAIGFELDYTGPLTEAPSASSHFTHISKFQPGEYIYAVALNDRGERTTKLRPWPRYSKEQMEALVPIARLLVDQYGVQIVGHEEINSGKLDPGPAFPMTRFKEIVKGKPEGSVLYNVTAQDLELRTGPGMVYHPLPGGKLAAGTPVSTSSDHDGWALVEVMAEVEGNNWLVGWTPLETIIAEPAIPVVKKHKLFTSDGRQYEFIAPHINNYDSKNRDLTNPKYLIMHTTGGIAMESTKNAFLDGNHRASAHLLIGRDGRVMQFVDFDTVAYHCGQSYWEEDVHLNRCSIGIEIDNGSILKWTDDVWKWNTTIIPNEDVQEARYWKRTDKAGWHRFPDVQLQVLKDIVRALQEAYDGIQVVLGHDAINLLVIDPDTGIDVERVDPGPLFPLADFQELVSGEPGVLVKVYQTLNDPDRKTIIYKNPDQKPPDINHPQHPGLLPKGTKINVLDKDASRDWTRVKVKAESGPFRGTEGWIRKSAVDDSQTNQKTKNDSDYFKLNPRALSKPPFTILRQSPLPGETRLRVQKCEGDFALVASLVTVREKYIEGWVKKDAIEFVAEERIIYPPVLRSRSRKR